MTDTRRKLLKITSTVGVAGLVKYWEPPVVRSIVLPAHAITSLSSPTTPPPLPPAPLVFSLQGIVCTTICEMGVDDAQYNIPRLANTSAEPLTVTGISLSNPNHYFDGSLPINIPAGDEGLCGFSVIVKDSGRSCGEDISNGTLTLQITGFQDYSINIPVSM